MLELHGMTAPIREPGAYRSSQFARHVESRVSKTLCQCPSLRGQVRPCLYTMLGHRQVNDL